MRRHSVTLALVLLLAAAPAVAAPEGELTWAVHISLAPTWFDPAETPSVITPFMMLYALHDALVKPMPGHPLAPSLAESWSLSKDGLAYEFVLRKGVKFHNGDPVSAEDVKFSLERYKGGAAATFKARVAGVDVVDPQRVRIRLKQPWPDFMTFYGSPATGAGWIVPKKYAEREAADPSLGARRHHAPGHAQARRGGHRLLAPRPAGRGGATHLRPHAQGRHPDVHGVAGVRRAVGPEVAVGRPARPSRREPRDRPQGAQRLRVPRVRARVLEHHPPRVPVLLAGAAVPARREAREEIGRASCRERV